jgi:hypothetical protein
MLINPEVPKILGKHKIDRSAGLLVLLGYYFDLDVDSVCPEEAVKAINTTKIVERDFKTRTIKWNVELFQGQELDFEWVKEWVEKFTRINPSRVGAWQDAVLHMKEFFSKYPKYRVDDVMNATDDYLSTVKDGQYLKAPIGFIFEGRGATKTSMLLGYCQKIESKPQSQMRGKIIK